MPRLLVNPGTPDQWEIHLKPGLNTLGRSPDCDFQVEHGSVSGTHCRITVGDGAAKIKDLGSTNGTFLERAPVHEASLTSGQHLQLGSVDMQFLTDVPTPVSAGNAVPTGLRAVATESTSASLPAMPRAALRVASSESPPPEPPLPPPPAYAPDEYSVSPAAPASCKYHPKSIARWLCTHCQLNFCDLCVTSRPGGSHGGRFCRRCSNECVALQVQLVDPAAGKRNFFAALPGAFAYPFQGAGAWFIVVGAIFYAMLAVMSFVARFSLYGAALFFVRIAYAGYVIAYLQRILQIAAQGDDDPPSWPDFTEFWQDILLPFLQAVALFAFCFGPAAGLLISVGAEAFNTGNPDSTKLLILILVVIAGAVYFPMATLAVAMADSVIALNPLVVIPAIVRVPAQYLLVLVLTGLIFAVYVSGSIAFKLLVPIPILPGVIMGAVMFYLLTVWARALGLMYFATRERLGWFKR